MAILTYRGVAYDTKKASGSSCTKQEVKETYRGITYNKVVEVCK